MAKNSVIKWRNQDVKDLRKAVNDFNKKVRKLKSTRKDKSYLPDEIDFAGTKDLIKTRSELNRVLNSLGRFKGKEAFKKVVLPSGEALTNWEKKELSIQKAQAVRRIKRRMAEIDKPYYKMGNQEFRRLEAELKILKNAFKKSGQEFQKVKSMIENLGSSDYEVRRALLYKQNWLEMFRKEFSSFENFDKIYKKLESIQNPITFYNKIKNLSYGELISDIKFMYDSMNAEQFLQIMAEELGIETEDSQVLEGE